MEPISRRHLFALAAGAALPARARALTAIGVQLYTVRGVLPARPLETLKELESIGYAEVEAVADGLDRIWPSFQQTSLKPVSIHLATSLFMADKERLPAALDLARQRGFRFAVCPYIAPQDRGGADMMRRLAGNLNEAGTLCRERGMRLCYHNHAFEFRPEGSSTLLDILMEATDPALVGLELDIMWARVAGLDPAAVIDRYGGRVALVHLKNLSEAVPPRFDEQVPRTAFAEVGQGVIDIPSVLRAAARAGVSHYFVEQDQTPADPLVSLRGSYQYLAKLDF